MNRGDFRVLHRDELVRLGLENEALSVEVEVLRAKLTEIDSILADRDAVIVERNRMVSERNARIAERNATIGKRDRLIAELRTRLDEVSKRKESQVLVDREEYEALKQARRDLQWTLDRLARTPLIGDLMKRRPGFGRLAKKYLRD